MDGKRITAEELQTELQANLKVLVERIADAINRAKIGGQYLSHQPCGLCRPTSLRLACHSLKR
jgi:hypothetical protein